MKLSASSVRKSERFKDRFKGRITLMNREGDYGVAKNARLPITKLQ